MRHYYPDDERPDVPRSHVLRFLRPTVEPNYPPRKLGSIRTSAEAAALEAAYVAARAAADEEADTRAEALVARLVARGQLVEVDESDGAWITGASWRSYLIALGLADDQRGWTSRSDIEHVRLVDLADGRRIN